MQFPVIKKNSNQHRQYVTSLNIWELSSIFFMFNIFFFNCKPKFKYMQIKTYFCHFINVLNAQTWQCVWYCLLTLTGANSIWHELALFNIYWYNIWYSSCSCCTISNHNSGRWCLLSCSIHVCCLMYIYIHVCAKTCIDVILRHLKTYSIFFYCFLSSTCTNLK